MTMRNAKLRTPFDREVLEKARQLAMQYRLLLDVNEQGVYLGTAMELPRVLARGATADECVRNMREALTTAVATFLEMGKAPPLPLRQNRRDEQINVRVT